MEIVAVTKENQADFNDILSEPIDNPIGQRFSVGLTDDGKVVGAAVMDDSGYNIEVEYLYILPEFRRKGYAGAFITELILAGAKRGGLFVTAEFPQDREGVEELFLSLGFIVTGRGNIYYFPQKGMIGNKTAKDILFKNIKGTVRPVSSLRGRDLNSLKEYISSLGYNGDVVTKSGFNPYLSSCVFNEKGDLLSFMLCSEYGNDIIVELLSVRGKNSTVQLLTFRFLFERLSEREEKGKLSEDGRVVFLPRNDDMVSSMIKVFEAVNLKSDDFYIFAARECF